MEYSDSLIDMAAERGDLGSIKSLQTNAMDNEANLYEMKLTVVKCPDESLAMTNYMYMNKDDMKRLSDIIDPFVRIGSRVYETQALGDVPMGKVALDAVQRNDAGVSIGQTIGVHLFNPDTDSAMVCKDIEMEFDLVSRTQRARYVDFDQLPARLRKMFHRHYFSVGQKVAAELDGVKLNFTINSCNGPTKNRYLYYQLNPSTNITLVHSGNPMLQDVKNRIVIRDVVNKSHK